MADWQTLAALGAVVVAAVYVVRRLRAPSRTPCSGCGGECAAPPPPLVEIPEEKPARDVS